MDPGAAASRGFGTVGCCCCKVAPNLSALHQEPSRWHPRDPPNRRAPRRPREPLQTALSRSRTGRELLATEPERRARPQQSGCPQLENNTELLFRLQRPSRLPDSCSRKPSQTLTFNAACAELGGSPCAATSTLTARTKPCRGSFRRPTALFQVEWGTATRHCSSSTVTGMAATVTSVSSAPRNERTPGKIEIGSMASPKSKRQSRRTNGSPSLPPLPEERLPQRPSAPIKEAGMAQPASSKATRASH